MSKRAKLMQNLITKKKRGVMESVAQQCLHGIEDEGNVVTKVEMKLE